MKTATRNIVLDDMRVWLNSERNKSFQFDKRINAITAILDKNLFDDTDWTLMASHLGILSNWYLIRGTVCVAEGHQLGWADLLKGMYIEYWHIRLLYEQWEKDFHRNKQARVELLRPSMCLAMAISFDREDISKWIGNRLALSIEDKAFGQWDCTQLPKLMLNLYYRYIGQTNKIFSSNYVDSSVYKKVFSSWDQKDHFRQAILDICDYHVNKSTDKGDYSIGEFSRYPFNIIPFEIFAINKVRCQEGFEPLNINHQLLTAPFESVPSGVVVNDEIIEKLSVLKG
jgi:hypothetical protein